MGAIAQWRNDTVRFSLVGARMLLLTDWGAGVDAWIASIMCGRVVWIKLVPREQESLCLSAYWVEVKDLYRMAR